jgi:hypothetical protein
MLLDNKSRILAFDERKPETWKYCFGAREKGFPPKKEKKNFGRFTCGREPDENPFDFTSTFVWSISVRKVLEKKHEHNRVEIINSKTAEDKKNKQKKVWIIDWNPSQKFCSVFRIHAESRVLINYEAWRKPFYLNDSV